MMAEYAAVLGANFTPLDGPDYNWDVWVQDEIEFATATGSGGERLNIVIDSIRDRGLAPLADTEMVGPGTIAATWGDGDQVTSFDSFGNLEASPPVFGRRRRTGSTRPVPRRFRSSASRVGCSAIGAGSDFAVTSLR